MTRKHARPHTPWITLCSRLNLHVGPCNGRARTHTHTCTHAGVIEGVLHANPRPRVTEELLTAAVSLLNTVATFDPSSAAQAMVCVPPHGDVPQHSSPSPSPSAAAPTTSRAVLLIEVMRDPQSGSQARQEAAHLLRSLVDTGKRGRACVLVYWSGCGYVQHCWNDPDMQENGYGWVCGFLNITTYNAESRPQYCKSQDGLSYQLESSSVLNTVPVCLQKHPMERRAGAGVYSPQCSWPACPCLPYAGHQHDLLTVPACPCAFLCRLPARPADCMPAPVFACAGHQHDLLTNGLLKELPTVLEDPATSCGFAFLQVSEQAPQSAPMMSTHRS